MTGLWECCSDCVGWDMLLNFAKSGSSLDARKECRIDQLQLLVVLASVQFGAQQRSRRVQNHGGTRGSTLITGRIQIGEVIDVKRAQVNGWVKL